MVMARTEIVIVTLFTLVIGIFVPITRLVLLIESIVVTVVVIRFDFLPSFGKHSN